jgi:hypothetical protein
MSEILDFLTNLYNTLWVVDTTCELDPSTCCSLSNTVSSTEQPPGPEDEISESLSDSEKKAKS